MERELFSIEWSDKGWVVHSDVLPKIGPDPNQAAALRHAQRLAKAHFADTGRPTGVLARFSNGDAVLLNVHG